MADRLSLSSFDLNLLVQLDLLLEESSVSAAATRAGVTQSAMSRALGRLRTAFGDELLVQAGRGMEPTAFARELTTPLRAVLQDIDRRILSPPSFSPGEAEIDFRVAAVDFAEVLMLAPLAARLRTEGPGISLTLTGTRDAFRGGLASGAVDLAIGVVSGDRASIKGRRLLDDRFVCAMGSRNPLATSDAVDLDAFTERAHVLVSPSGRGRGRIDDVLASLGRSRDIAVRTTSFHVALELAARSDLVVTVPSLVASYATGLAVEFRNLAFDVPPVTLSMLWHATRQADPAHAWLRAQLVAEAEKLTTPPGAGRTGRRTSPD